MHELLRTLIELTIASSAATALALAIRKPAQRAFGPRVAYVVWSCVPIALIATLLPGGVMNTAVLHVPVSVDALLPHELASARPSGATAGATIPQAAIDWSTWAAAAWAVGAFAFLAYLIGLQRAYLRSLGSLFEHGGMLRAEQPAGCPAVVGVFRPRVILPADFESRYTQEEQMLVLAHECVHLHRADAMWNALAAVLRCLFWFNPLIHYAARRFRVDQELSCDAAVMQRYPEARRVYGDAMLKTQLADGALPAGCHWRSVHPLKERLMMLKHPVPGFVRRAIGSAFVVTLSVAVGYAAWAAEPAMPAPPSPPQAFTAEPQPPAPASDVQSAAQPPAPAALSAEPATPAPPAPPALSAEPTMPAPPAPPALPAEPAMPAPPAASVDAAPVLAVAPVEPMPALPAVAPVEPVPALPAVEPVEPAPPVPAAADAATAAAFDLSAFHLPAGSRVTVTADAVDQRSDQEVELRHVKLLFGEPPHQTMISADLGRRTAEGEWVFEGDVFAQNEKVTGRFDKVKLTRDGALTTVGPGAAYVTTHSPRAE